MIGQTISHYKILEKIATGGMGSVYKAEDVYLHRSVVLKFLPATLSDNKEVQERFIQEAQAASSLDHPNICTIFEIGYTDDGNIFIAMAYYEGQTLKEKLGFGPLSIGESINIALQIIQGLATAHEHGIVHRDIKPANIMITNNGTVKILDFGLAKLKGRTQVTKPGSTMGTVAYMSPEQAKGDEVDLSTDIWSVGVVLYEMLSGKLPFSGDYDHTIIYSILKDRPKEFASIGIDIPLQLERIVLRMLSKNPDDRYHTIKEVDEELDAINDRRPLSKYSTYTEMKQREFKKSSFQKIDNIRIYSRIIKKWKEGIKRYTYGMIIGVLVVVVILSLWFILTLKPSRQPDNLWSTDSTSNTAICIEKGYQEFPKIVSDGAGGAIITWQDLRKTSGSADIYAQHVDASGAVQWTGNGVAICTAANNQLRPTAVSDGVGGAIITWYDYRDSSDDIYAQRINASGIVQWTNNGVAICTVANNQSYPAIVSDGAGGAIITWYDHRGTSDDIYAQRIDISGTVQWKRNGVAICTEAGYQYYPIIVSDGAGGAIITWYDHRNDTDDIYAQHINISGVVQWKPNGVAICTANGYQEFPTIISDGAGGAIITWHDLRIKYGQADIYAQLIDASGIMRWDMNGIAICTAANDQFYPTIVSDGAGGAIITWYDNRNGPADIYTQRVNASGEVQWDTNGISICTLPGNQEFPTIVPDGAGGAIITWHGNRKESADIYAQCVNDSGAVKWTTNGVAISTAKDYQSNPTIVSDGAGGAIITWYDHRNGQDDIYAQQVDRNGQLGKPTVQMKDEILDIIRWIGRYLFK